MSAAPAPLPLDLDDLAALDTTGLALNPLALAAESYWEAGLFARQCLDDGLTVAARDWANTLAGLSLVGHPRLWGLARVRAEQIGAALTRFYADEVA